MYKWNTNITNKVFWCCLTLSTKQSKQKNEDIKNLEIAVIDDKKSKSDDSNNTTQTPTVTPIISMS